MTNKGVVETPATPALLIKRERAMVAEQLRTGWLLSKDQLEFLKGQLRAYDRSLDLLGEVRG